MRSNNPVLSRSEAFARGGYATFDTASAERARLEDLYAAPTASPLQTGRMTIDDVVTKTAMTLGVLVLAGAATWYVVPEELYGFALLAALVGFGLALVNTFKRVPSPGLVLAYGAVEGIFLGAVSKVFEGNYPGIVVQAVIGSGAVFAAMLYLYKSRRIRVTPRFTKMVLGAALGFLGLLLVNLVASFFVEGGFGLRSGGLGIVVGLVAIGLAAMFLVLDFDAIEQGVRLGAPERESWRAAFGLTVTLVWLYLEMLRLLSILRGEE
jgi:uncharacterized YccA/Bax inhibitor family protein